MVSAILGFIFLERGRMLNAPLLPLSPLETMRAYWAI